MFGGADMSHSSMHHSADDDAPPEPLLLEHGSSSSCGRLDGDFYRMDDDVTRSVRLGPGPVPSELFGYGGKIGSFEEYGYGDALKYGDFGGGATAWDKKIVLQEMEPTVAFSDAVLPRELELCEVSSFTSLLLRSSSPAEALNCMLRWLEGNAHTSITKVRPQKFALKADIFEDLSCCTQFCSIKIRAFAVPLEPGAKPEVLVEVRKVKGDSVAFKEVFDQASQRLRDIDPDVRRLKGKMPIIGGAAVAAQPTGVVATSDCQPHVDMMTSCSPELQAEAVAALASLASANAAGAIPVCAALVKAQEVLEALAGIFTATAHAELSIEVSYPAAQLFASIARNGAFGGREPELERLLLAALEGIGADGTPDMVRMELANAVCDAVRCSGSSMAPFAQELHASLSETSRKPVCAPVHGRIHEALSALCVP